MPHGLGNISRSHIKCIYSEKATKFCEISTLLLSYLVPVKIRAENPQNFMFFSEYMNFKILETLQRLPLYCRAYRSSRSSNGSRSKQQQQFGGCNYEDQASLWRSREAPVSSKTAECGRRRRCTAGKTAQRRRTTMATSVHRPIAWRPHLQPFFNQSTNIN